MIFLWEVNFIFMQISFIVSLLQHGDREHTLYHEPSAKITRIHRASLLLKTSPVEVLKHLGYAVPPPSLPRSY